MTDTTIHSSSTMATLSKLTSISTQTLTLLLERQRLESLSTNSTSLHLPQITRNLQQLRTGIVDLEEKEGNIEAVRLLKSQYERMRGMLGAEADVAGVPRCVCAQCARSLGSLWLAGCSRPHQRRPQVRPHRLRRPRPRRRRPSRHNILPRRSGTQRTRTPPMRRIQMTPRRGRRRRTRCCRRSGS